MITAQEALDRLKQGNQEFTSGIADRNALMAPARRAELTKGQAPFATILACSDSRVPTEIVFNQGFGDLFVIRVAGNIVAASQIGSVEYAAAYLGARLLVVMGHTQCGAIAATLAELQQPVENQSPNLLSLVDFIRPSVAALLETDLRHNPEALAAQAIRANVWVSVDHLRHGSQILENLVQSKGLRVVGAEYSLETGRVEFFEE